MEKTLDVLLKYAVVRGKSPEQLASMETSKWAAGLKLDEKRLTVVKTAIETVVAKNEGKELIANPITSEFSPKFKGVVMKNLPSAIPAPAAKKVAAVAERPTVIDILQLPVDRRMVEMDRIGLRLLRQDAVATTPHWPNAHGEKGQYSRFVRVVENVTGKLADEFEHFTKEQAEQKLTAAFSGLQRKILREEKSELAKDDFEIYLKSIGFTVGGATDIGKGTVSKSHADETLEYMQYRGSEVWDALSVITDMDWPATNGQVQQTPEEDFSDFEAAPAAEAEEEFLA